MLFEKFYYQFIGLFFIPLRLSFFLWSIVKTRKPVLHSPLLHHSRPFVEAGIRSGHWYITKLCSELKFNKLPIKFFVILIVVGCCTSVNIVFAAETKAAEDKKIKEQKSLVFKSKNILAATASIEKSRPSGFVIGDTGHFLGDFDNLTRLMESHETPLSAYTPDWLDMAIEHRTRYEAYDNGFTSAIPGDDQQVHMRTRFLFEFNKKDPLSFALELSDFRAPVAEHGQQNSAVFSNHFDFTQLRVNMRTENFFRTGLPGEVEIGRMVMDFGEGRLIAGHRFGPFTPTFDGVQLTVGSNQKGWGARVFGTSPVNREPFELDDFKPVTFFSGAQITNRDISLANADLYFFALNEGDKKSQRNIYTTGFRVYALPIKGKLDYEIESMYQFGEVANVNYFANRHHGEVGYSFRTEMPFRMIYLFDYASGDRDPNKNFDFLFAKRRVEFGPTGILGVFFPSNILSPVGMRATLDPTPTVRLMMSQRAFWLADKRGSFVGTGLQDPTGQSGSYLGSLFDMSLRWSPKFSYWKRMSFDIGYTHLFKGDYYDKVPQSPGSAGTNYGYTMVTFKF